MLLPGDSTWEAFATRIRNTAADAILLNEMPFGRWVSAEPEFDRTTITGIQQLHDEGLRYLSELNKSIIFGTRAASHDGCSVNEGFVWESTPGASRPVHTKQFFPDEAGYYEARWFERGETHFQTVTAGAITAGFMICTEVMFNEWARHYGRNGANLILVPRATPAGSIKRWQIAMAMAAVVSGCYVASSNRAGDDGYGQRFAGRGWIYDPSGDLIAETSPEHPVATAELDLALVELAQREYPCYVKELEE